MPFDRTQLKKDLATLAAQGVFVGTSSWKYTGWLGALYDESRYRYRGKVAESRFEKNCLREYAEVFKTVCVDAAYYKFPEEKFLSEMVSQVPEDFLFGFKVTDEITVKQFPNLPRFGPRAGRDNQNYLNSDLFAQSFLKPCEPFRKNIGLIIFEFSRFHSMDYEHGRDFMADLDRLLTSLPTGWPYAVEIRNRQWLQPGYFECLSRHGIPHVYNSWEAMPPVAEQIQLPGSETNPNLVAARFLLKPGRAYEDAVKTFKPYDKVKDQYDGARSAGAELIKRGMSYNARRKTFIYVNNRLEGNALESIAAMLRIFFQPGAGTASPESVP